MKRTARLETDTPLVSDATIARIRAAARQFIQAGGSIFPSTNPSDVDEHIGNVVTELVAARGEQAGEIFARALEDTPLPSPEDRGRLSNLAGLCVAETGAAAFLFGAFVGLELAALTVGQAVTLPLNPTRRTTKRKRG
jgi:hypothetical protein